MSPTSESRTVLDFPAEEMAGEVRRRLEAIGEPAFRADQLLDWLFSRRILDPEEMTNLPKELRARLPEALPPGSLSLERTHLSSDGTIKYLWRRPEGGTFESVRIPTHDRTTLCVSSQVGCSLACRFCATGFQRFEANLRPGEMVEQVLRMLEGEARNESVNVVFMGMGEPFLNTENVLAAAETMNRHADIGARRITISTAGVVPGIEALASFPLQVRLAVSLHAPTDELRAELMPHNARWPVDELMAACRAYHRATSRQISFEYVQLPGLNDTVEMTRALADLLRDLPAKVNVIPFNPVEGADYRPPTEEETEAFVARLHASLRQGVSVRRNRGDDVTAACGQLRTTSKEAPASP